MIEFEKTHLEIPTLLRAKEVARILNVSRALAYVLMQRGDIPTIHIHHAVRVRPSDLEEFISRSRTTANG